jgi:lipoyl synthase
MKMDKESLTVVNKDVSSNKLSRHTAKQRLPEWFKVRLPTGQALEKYNKVKSLRHGLKLHTVCEEASCPNIHECWGRGTGTFMIMGDTCTRACRYCDVNSGRPYELDKDEPKHVGEAIAQLKLKYVVITSVTRDDLPDHGAEHYAQTMEWCTKLCPETKIELLIPDFMADKERIQKVINSKPYVLGHNIETVRSIYPKIRPKPTYDIALDVLKKIKEQSIATKIPLLTKSALMVGHGETIEEIEQTMKDLREVNCDIFSIGQYLRPSSKHVKIQKFYTPDEFKELQSLGLKLGFKNCVAGPLVRSSYLAEQAVGLQIH